MAATTYYPRSGGLAMRVLRHMQLHGKPMSRADIRELFGERVANQMAGAVSSGLLIQRGSPIKFYPTDALDDADLDGRRRPITWTDERVDMLVKRYQFDTNAALAEKLGVTENAVAIKAWTLGLKKTETAKRRSLLARDLSRRYVTTSQRTEQILQLMREGKANGATGRQIGQMIGARSSAVSGALRHAILAGIVGRVRINKRHYTYHLSNGAPAAPVATDDDDEMPVQIIVPAGAACRPVRTKAPNSVFALGGITHTTTTTNTAP